MVDRGDINRQYESAVVRLVVSGPDRSTAGLGVLVGTRQVVTCAHVVNKALGRGERDQVPPPASALVQLEFPLLGDADPLVRTGRVDAWVPPPEVGARGGDVAGLILNEDAPMEVVPARFSNTESRPGMLLRVFGYPDPSVSPPSPGRG